MDAALTAKLRLDSSQFSGGLSRALRETSVSVGKMSAQFSSLRNVMSGGIVGGFAIGMVSNLLDANIQVEKMEAAMAATVGSAELGKKQLAEVRSLAGDIGLEMASAAKSMIQFQSAGMSSADAMATIKSGYNAILASGGGAAEFSRFSVAITQLRASPKVLQEELNQLREALPTTAKLMMQAFGVTRAEDIQKLNISGKEFVATLLNTMEALPQVGDTMEKQIGRFKAQLDQFKAGLGEAVRPIASGLMSGATFFMQAADAISAAAADSYVSFLYGAELVEEMRRKRMRNIEALEAEKYATDNLKAAQEALTKLLATQEEERTSRNAIKAGNEWAMRDGEIAGEKFWEGVRIEDEKAEQARRDAMWENVNAMDAGIKAGEEFWQGFEQAEQEKKVASFAALEQAEEALKGPAQEAWRKKFDEAGMSRSERKSQRQADREFDKNVRKAADKEAREMLRKERGEAKNNAFDNLKKNQFFDDEGAKKRLKDQARKEADDAAKRSVITLGEIRDILKTLSVA